VRTIRRKPVMMQPNISDVLTAKPGMYLGAEYDGQMYDPLEAHQYTVRFKTTGNTY
jgi:hypothetical protein